MPSISGRVTHCSTQSVISERLGTVLRAYHLMISTSLIGATGASTAIKVMAGNRMWIARKISTPDRDTSTESRSSDRILLTYGSPDMIYRLP